MMRDLLFVVLLAAASPAWADLAAVKQRGALRVLAVVDRGEPEFVSLASSASPGFDLEVLLGFAKSQKLELKVVPVAGWPGLVPALIGGGGDMVAGRVAATARRRMQIEFTQEVFPSRAVVVTRRPTPAVQDLAALKAASVGTIAGTSMYEALLAAGVRPAAIDSSLAPGELSGALRGGKVAAAVWWLEGALLAQRRDRDLEIGLALGPAESLAYGVRREDRELLAALNQHIAVVRSSGTWNRLAMKYFGDTIPEILKRAKE